MPFGFQALCTPSNWSVSKPVPSTHLFLPETVAHKGLPWYSRASLRACQVILECHVYISFWWHTLVHVQTPLLAVWKQSQPHRGDLLAGKEP